MSISLEFWNIILEKFSTSRLWNLGVLEYMESSKYCICKCFIDNDNNSKKNKKNNKGQRIVSETKCQSKNNKHVTATKSESPSKGIFADKLFSNTTHDGKGKSVEDPGMSLPLCNLCM